MEFAAYLKEGKVVKGQKDVQKAKALVAMAKNELLAARSLPLNETTASSALCLAYNALRELLDARTLLEGYKVYSHEAYTVFLKEKGEVMLAEQFDRFRKLRNGVEYYGRAISVAVAKEGREEMALLCEQLFKKVRP